MWMIPKYGPQGVPYDYFLFTRDNSWSCAKVDRLLYKFSNDRLDVMHSGLSPTTVPTKSRSMVHDGVQIQIMNGKIKVVGRLVRLGEHEAEFDDGLVLQDIDSVVFATGYDFSLSFLDEKIKEGKYF